jgi:two-component system, OmpR family, sensor histidine kinase KdpD
MAGLRDRVPPFATSSTGCHVGPQIDRSHSPLEVWGLGQRADWSIIAGGMTSTALSPLLKARRPSRLLGIVVAIVGVALATIVVYPLERVAPVVSLSVVYLLAVVAVSTFWGLGFGIATGLASALAFNFFHLRPVGRLSLSDSREWVSLSAFIAVAIATGLLGELARARAQEADQRRREADISADLARLLLAATHPEEALAAAGERLAQALGVRSASIELGETAEDNTHSRFPLYSADERIGTLLLPIDLPEAERRRVSERIVPSLESILAASKHRSDLQAEVVETAALRRSDEIKTAVLRSVSHDLRTPVTAILTAATALDPQRSGAERLTEARDLITEAATRLSRLIDKLLDLSLLQAGSTRPRADWYSIEEVLQEAIEQVDGSIDVFRLTVDPHAPLLRGDPSQLERAFANVLENSARHRAGKPVLVRARAIAQTMRVRIVDQGPGISSTEQERIFLPFYRSAEGDGRHEGSGLGLAIAKGFIEAGGGRIWVESTPPNGTSFVVELPIPLSDNGAPPEQGR